MSVYIICGSDKGNKLCSRSGILQNADEITVQMEAAGVNVANFGRRMFSKQCDSCKGHSKEYMGVYLSGDNFDIPYENVKDMQASGVINMIIDVAKKATMIGSLKRAGSAMRALIANI